MTIQAVAFDVGHTLVRYANPLNWKALYVPALTEAALRCGAALSEDRLGRAVEILTKYNTREHPREAELPSEVIFGEILAAWGLPLDGVEAMQSAFFAFFQTGAECYGDAAETLRALRAKGLRLGALTDVAYGMGRALALRDLREIEGLLDAVLTSVDVGYRKPHRAGFLRLARELGVAPDRMMYVGDEQKDIAGANALGIASVLIRREGDPPDWGQAFTVRSLREIGRLV
ncbi:MAG TPA: HAD family hydrolase [Clostridia bacterium]|nr:HAD family hydrolase [Clostridia bacterium]